MTTYTPTALDLYWEEQPEPIYTTTDDDDRADVMDRAVAYADELEEEAAAAARHRGAARIEAAFEGLMNWHQIADEARVPEVVS